MKDEIVPKQIQERAARMISILGLYSQPVGVRLVPGNGGRVPPGAERLSQHRYCQALMKARRGRDVVLDKEGISCPAAAAAFGFHPLPKALQSGRGLVGFGIVSDEVVGRKMFIDMPRLDPDKISMLHLFPLEKAEYVPDLVVVEDEVEKLMWIVLSYLHAKGGAASSVFDRSAASHLCGFDHNPFFGKPFELWIWMLRVSGCHGYWK